MLRLDPLALSLVTCALSLNGMLGFELNTWMPENLMMKADKVLMAHSLEGRFPFLDLDLYRFAQKLPAAMKLPNARSSKHVLRQLMARQLPKSVIQRQKMGFTVPPIHLLEPMRSRLMEAIEQLRPTPVADVLDLDGHARAGRGWLIGGPTPGPISLKLIGGFDLTDAAALPDGGIVVLDPSNEECGLRFQMLDPATVFPVYEGGMGLARVGCGGSAVGGGRVVGVAAVVGGGAAGLRHPDGSRGHAGKSGHRAGQCAAQGLCGCRHPGVGAVAQDPRRDRLGGAGHIGREGEGRQQDDAPGAGIVHLREGE